MNIGEVCSRETYVVRRDEPLARAVREMRNRRVGAIVVVEDLAGKVVRPIGMVTDRDVVRGQLSRHADLFCLSVGDVMTDNPLTVTESSDIGAALESLCRRGVRRAPVVDEAGCLVGLVSVDDLLPVVARELSALAELIGTHAQRA